MKNDDFGNRMKDFESFETGRRFLPMLPIYARIDGRTFSKFTKGLERPYDQRMIDCMVATTKHLVKETNAKIGYCQSDEISLVWMTESYDSEIFFNGKIQKMVSVISSLATAAFTNAILNSELSSYASKLPHFDARVFQLPNKIEAANVILWRCMDATKNAVSMAASHYYSHKELIGKSGSEKQEMLFQKGINFNDYNPAFKQGVFVRRKQITKILSQSELDLIPNDRRPNDPTVIRNVVDVIDMPIFSKVINRVGVIFDGDEPLVS